MYYSTIKDWIYPYSTYQNIQDTVTVLTLYVMRFVNSGLESYLQQKKKAPRNAALSSTLIFIKRKRYHAVAWYLFLAEDKRFAQFAVPESAFAIRSASSTTAPFFPSLFRPPDALGQNAHAAERGSRLEFICAPKATAHTQTRMGCCWRRTRDSKYAWDVSPCSAKRQKVRF